MHQKLLFLTTLTSTNFLLSSNTTTQRPSSNLVGKRIREAQEFKEPTSRPSIPKLALPAIPTPQPTTPKNLPVFSSHTHRIEQSLFTLGNCEDSRFSIIFTCIINSAQPLNPDNMQFKHDKTGILWAIYKETQQELGHFPTHILDTQGIEIKWTGSDAQPTGSLTLSIPARIFVIKNDN